MTLLTTLQTELLTAMKQGDRLRAEALRSLKAGLEHGVDSLTRLSDVEVRTRLGRHRQRLVSLLATYAALGARAEWHADVVVHELAVAGQLLPPLSPSNVEQLLRVLLAQEPSATEGRLIGLVMRAAPGQVDPRVARAKAQRLLDAPRA